MKGTEWIKEAEKLPLGHKKRTHHSCSTSKDMLISRSIYGISGYCFRCGPQGFFPSKGISLEEYKEALRLREEADLKASRSLSLPEDSSTSIAPEGLCWLGKAGISAGKANSLGFLWSPRLYRVILPFYKNVLGGRELIYWQGRALLSNQTKYINPPVDKSELLLLSGEQHEQDRICVVEDRLSAEIVGHHCKCLTPLGTTLSTVHLEYLSRHKEVLLWLDPDSAGMRAARKLHRTLSLVCSTKIIKSPCDPKYLSHQDIRLLLGLPPNNQKYEVVYD